MKVVWDVPKRLANRAKHGFDLADAVGLSWRDALYQRGHSGREKAVGWLDESVVAIVFRRLGEEGLSIISIRPASVKARRALDAKGS